MNLLQKLTDLLGITIDESRLSPFDLQVLNMMRLNPAGVSFEQERGWTMIRVSAIPKPISISSRSGHVEYLGAERIFTRRGARAIRREFHKIRSMPVLEPAESPTTAANRQSKPPKPPRGIVPRTDDWGDMMAHASKMLATGPTAMEQAVAAQAAAMRRETDAEIMRALMNTQRASIPAIKIYNGALQDPERQGTLSPDSP